MALTYHEDINMSNVVIILVAAAVFLALILWFTVDTKHVRKWTGISFLIAIGGGLIIYGVIDADQFKDMPVIAVLRTVVHVGRMFGNAGDGSHDAFVAIAGKSIFTSMFYWLVHFFAYYSVVSALVLAIGKDILKGFRTWLLRFRDIELVFGISDETIKLGEAIGKDGHKSLVFVGNGTVPESVINRTGALIYDDEEALRANTSFVRRLSLKKGKRRIRVSALSLDDEGNYSYAVNMLKSLKEADISCSNTELVMFARSASLGAELQALNDNYGYGSVKVFERTELAARLLFRKYPIAGAISFDNKGKAIEDVNVLMVGFGPIGQEILRRIVSMGQFYDSSLHVHIFDPSYEKISGFYKARYPGLLDHYDISFEQADARSSVFADYVKKMAGSLKYIIIAPGNEAVGSEIAYGILDILDMCDVGLPVYQCYYDKIIRNHQNDECEVTNVFDEEILYGTRLDALSKEINHFYYGEGSITEQWDRCDYFSRMSCRASADYLSGLLKRLDLTSKDNDELSSDILENLAMSEHLRWMGFHYSMGYQPMTESEISQRKELYKKDNTVRILKDTKNKHHGCLVPWDELDRLSEFENSITGKNIDYKQMDRENIKAVYGIICRLEDK